VVGIAGGGGGVDNATPSGVVRLAEGAALSAPGDWGCGGGAALTAQRPPGWCVLRRAVGTGRRVVGVAGGGAALLANRIIRTWWL